MNSSRESTDEEIRARLKERRYPEAFELAVDAYQKKVYRLAYSMLGNQSMAEDAAQEIFIRVWRALPGYRGTALVSTWIFAIARNTCLTALKSSSRGRALSMEDPEVRFVAEMRSAAAPGQFREPDLLRLVSELPRKYRQVITLFYMEERSYEEVAKMLDLPVGTVKSYLHRAKKLLAAAMVRSKMAKGAS